MKLRSDPFSDGAIKSGFIHEPAIHHRLHDGFAVLLRFGQDIVGLRFLQNVLIDKKIEDLLDSCSRSNVATRLSYSR